VGDELWQYPSLTAIPIVVISWIPGSYIVSFVATALVAYTFVFILLLRRWRSEASAGSTAGIWLWVTAGFWMGPVLVARLDIFVTLFAVAALLVVHRPLISAALMAIGFGIKFWPGVVSLAWPREQVFRRLAFFAFVSIALLMVSTLLFSERDAFLSRFSGRGLHAESVAAAPFLAMQLINNSYDSAFGSGTLEIDHPAATPLGTTLTVIGLLIIAGIAFLRWSNRLTALAAVDVVAISLLVLLSTSRVLSPQFYVWVTGILAVALLTRASRLRGVSLLVVASAFCAQYVYPLRTDFPDLDSVLVQLLRVVLLITATVWGLLIVWGEAKRNIHPSITTENGVQSDDTSS